MVRIGLVVAVVVLILGASWWFLRRPSVVGASGVEPHVTIECEASASLSEASCVEMGDQLLAAGVPTNTFEIGDLERLVISRPFPGFDTARCQVQYLIERYPDEPILTDDVECLGPGG